MDTNKTPDKNSGGKNDYLKWTSFTVEFGGVISVFCYIGYQVDVAVKSSPYFLLTGFFIGFIGMIYLVYKQTNDKNK